MRVNIKINNFIVIFLAGLEILRKNALCQHNGKLSESTDGPRSTIDFLLKPRKSSFRHQHHFLNTAQEKYQSSQLQNEVKNDGVIDFRDDVCTTSKKESIKRAMREVSCGKPRIEYVKLKPPAPNYVLVPDVVKVKRCSGFCHHSPHSCLPTKVSTIKIPVYRVDKTSTMDSSVCVDYRVEQHEECQCSCLILDKHCTAQQFYSKEKCACECANEEGKQNCFDLMGKEGNRFWDEASCSCQCYPLECPSKLVWVPQLCKCANVLSRDGVSNDDLINTLY